MLIYTIIEFYWKNYFLKYFKTVKGAGRRSKGRGTKRQDGAARPPACRRAYQARPQEP